MQIPFLARDFRSIQPARHTDFDSFATEAQRRIHGFTHGAPEGDAFLELQRNRFGDELGIELRPVDFLNVNVHFALGTLLDLVLQLIDFGALAADDDSGTRRKQADHQLISGAFDIDGADAGRTEAVLQLAAQHDILVQQIGIILAGKPSRTPGLVVTQPKAVWMCLLSQSNPSRIS